MAFQKRAVVGAVLAAFTFTASAFAADYAFVVRDYELSTAQAREITMKRIMQVADQACNVDDARALFQRAAAKSCVEEVVSTILDDIGNPQLTALYGESARIASR